MYSMRKIFVRPAIVLVDYNGVEETFPRYTFEVDLPSEERKIFSNRIEAVQ